MNADFMNKFLIPLIFEAGKIMLSAHEIERENAVTAKAGTANFVTVYDIKIQEFLMNEIKAKLPDACFIAEEKENDATVLNQEHCFIIDPIDATTNFIHDYRHSCISLAVFSHGEALFGAVYNPYLGELFHAQKGKGAYLNGQPMHVSSRPMSLAITAYGTSPYYKERFTEPTFRLCKELFTVGADIRRCGSAALDLAYTAAGRNDAFFEFLLSPWDIAAGALLITEAGGIVTDMKGKPIDYSAPSAVIAANPVVYPQLMKITEKFDFFEKK